MVRRSIAVGAGLIVLILLVLGVRGCLDSRKEQSFRDYVRDVAALLQESDSQSENLFALLTGAGGDGDVAIQNQLNAFARDSEAFAARAADTEHPDELDGVQRQLVEVLAFRRDGVIAIARALPRGLAAQGDEREGAAADVAGAMQSFLTGDVIFQTRVAPGLRDGLREQELGGESVPESGYLPDIEWLLEETVADRIVALGGSGEGADEEAAPGLHGNGLVAVALGGQALSPDAPPSVQATPDLAFDIQVQNQGESTETDVVLRVTVGEGADAIEIEETLDEIAAGETANVEIPLAERPPTGQTVPITIEVEPVPGEEVTDNNVGEFSAIFTS